MVASRRNRAQWAELTQRWKRSGLTATDFARLEGLNPNTFAFWRSKLRHEPVETPLAMVRLRTEPRPPSHSDPLQVVMADGLVVRVGPGADLDQLAQLICVLEERR